MDQQVRQRRRDLDDLLKIVQHEQLLTLAQVHDQLFKQRLRTIVTEPEGTENRG